MADKKISQLTAKALAIAATDLVEISESDGLGGFVSKSVTGANIAALTTPSGITGAIQFSNGTALDSDATNLFYDDTNNRLGVGQNVPTARVHIKGTAATNATTSLLIQNSAGTASLQCTDDLSVFSHGKGAVATNTVFGKGALQGAVTGANNVAIGVSALAASTIGARNTAIGSEALSLITLAFDNVAVGYQALKGSTNAFSENTAIGSAAMAGVLTAAANENVAIGKSSAASLTSGFNNVMIGSRSNGSGSSNTVIGKSANSSTFNGSLVLGAGATATAANQCVFGSAATVAGALAAEVNTSANVWNVVINGVAHKILLA